jgi:membrane-associated PAP2 superfamily phosphatase
MPWRGWRFYPERDDIKRVARINGCMITIASTVFFLLGLGNIILGEMSMAHNIWEALLGLLVFIGIFICGLWMIRWGRRQD